MRRRPWSHYAAPAAFLLAATILVVLIRSAVHHSPTGTTTVVAPPPPPRKTVADGRTTTRKKPTTAPRFYTVVAGDTFEVISSKTGVPAARIQQLNPNVQSTALYIGQRLRIR